MRGARAAPESRCRALGIIPAYAGSTLCIVAVGARPRDHPRVCGEHSFCTLVVATSRGSSPRMRGALRQGKRRASAKGIIPAYAGSTPATRARERGRWDHPRVCGEHPESGASCCHRLGSSPRMRGALIFPALFVSAAGIIPAYAGSTGRRHGLRAPGRDHPRVCGEHVVERGALQRERGSSPRMRGAQRRLLVGERRRGIIPAYAGSTDSDKAPDFEYEDHPRVCGEHRHCVPLPLIMTGSSPRMRGAPVRTGRGLARVGIIPAYAGSTCHDSSVHLPDEDHPRVCGEHAMEKGQITADEGSSPRMRGAR